MELLDELGEDITNARLRLRNHSSGYVLGKRPGDHHLVKGVSVVNETLIAFQGFFSPQLAHTPDHHTHPLISCRECRVDFLSSSPITTADISLIQSF